MKCYSAASSRRGMALYRCIYIALTFLLSNVAVAATFSGPADVARVFDLMQQRLAVMRSVAAWKYANNVAVTDAAREQQVLDATVARAGRLGIDAAPARE